MKLKKLKNRFKLVVINIIILINVKYSYYKKLLVKFVPAIAVIQIIKLNFIIKKLKVK